MEDQHSIESKWCLYNSPFRTYRKIRVIACVAPSEDIQNCELRKHGTGEHPFSNFDRQKLKLDNQNTENEDNDETVSDNW